MLCVEVGDIQTLTPREWFFTQKMKGVFMSVSKPVDIWTTWLYFDLSVSLMVASRTELRLSVML